jgi:hypothetical protein
MDRYASTSRPPGSTVISCALALASAFAVAADGCPHEIVARDAMHEVIASITGYDTGATTNQSRFVADFLFGLAEHPAIDAADSFQVQPDRFFSAWLDATGRKRETAPVSMGKVLEYGQRFVVDTDPPIRFESDVVEAPDRVLSVRVSWPDTPATPSHYVYRDRLAEPEVRMRHERVITYQIADFGDFVAFENVSGVSGRPTTGALGALFTLLGTAPIRSTRFAVAGDGTQVLRSRVRKLLGFTATATIAPDGTAARDVPDGRPVLDRLAERLAADFRLAAIEPPPRPCSTAR